MHYQFWEWNCWSSVRWCRWECHEELRQIQLALPGGPTFPCRTQQPAISTSLSGSYAEKVWPKQVAKGSRLLLTEHSFSHLRPLAAMYVEPIVLIFVMSLNATCSRSCKKEERKTELDHHYFIIIYCMEALQRPYWRWSRKIKWQLHGKLRYKIVAIFTSMPCCPPQLSLKSLYHLRWDVYLTWVN